MVSWNHPIGSNGGNDSILLRRSDLRLSKGYYWNQALFPLEIAHKDNLETFFYLAEVTLENAR